MSNKGKPWRPAEEAVLKKRVLMGASLKRNIKGIRPNGKVDKSPRRYTWVAAEDFWNEVRPASENTAEPGFPCLHHCRNAPRACAIRMPILRTTKTAAIISSICNHNWLPD